MSNIKSILLVEDDPGVRAMIVDFLSPAAYKVTEVDSVSAALEELETDQSFDAVILDFWLGKEHAVSIVDSIRLHLIGTPVIMISGGNGKMDLEMTKAISDVSGAFVFLQKPFRKADLLDVVASAIG
ncbi:DNA-binding NtrC family response regulator [Sulfitobacter undariae]|uniref:DNA-binding NtrC family response regulator n=1 Tax=Sulfitobacter undariae TaxID=1563671 RepID=A0A7W6H3M6_9RHOB|nr:DNA-binding NtrC family response regulator [Sulfitobacter undariae]